MQGEKLAPEHKDMVSVYFSDIVGFTTLCADISSAKVIACAPMVSLSEGPSSLTQYGISYSFSLHAILYQLLDAD
jgi:hypothetical protein